jgi:glycine/D-amino acid oxidase-like deaminating enzyme
MDIWDAVVVGAGIVGSIIAGALRKRGASVLLLDDRRPGAGTPPSGGHLNPTWFGGLPKAEHGPSLRVLDDVWGLLSERFVVRPRGLTTEVLRPRGRMTEVYRVDTDQVTRTPFTRGRVTGLSMLHNYPMVTWRPLDVVDPVVTAGREERCRLLVVATGAWAAELVPGTDVRPKQGVSFRLRATLEAPFIQSRARNLQVVAHQQGPGEVWVGDGTALKPSSWGPDCTHQCLARCLAALSLDAGTRPARTLLGLRPYAQPERPGDPCLLRRLGPRAWLVTGGRKLGTLAAGWATWRITAATS